jgi:hypothetical protein
MLLAVRETKALYARECARLRRLEALARTVKAKHAPADTLPTSLDRRIESQIRYLADLAGQLRQLCCTDREIDALEEPEEKLSDARYF